ncbi:kinase-like domain-containing protein [Rhizophagus irregularis DAOM 181602=DAOM 197198]|nr:kinase-like domain-containing protein [Rhizophagus irregularis DAOM 181602=DAOM 197198]
MQLSVHDNVNEALEWIPYNKLYDIKYITKDELGKVYRAIWIDGNIGENYYMFCSWSVNNNWIRRNPNMFVKLRSLTSPNDLTFELANKIKIEYEFYGITQDPETKNYMMYIAKGGFGEVYRAKRIDGNISYWDNKYQNWERKNQNISVILENLNYSNNITSESMKINKACGITQDLKTKLYGITQDPETKDYIMVMDYAKDGSLRNYLDTAFNKLNWDTPEILRGQKYTKAADIYSFGIIMYEVISGLPPYHDISHDRILSIKICQGLRPMFNIKVPQLIVHLIKRCLDAIPLNRPKAKEIRDELWKWRLGNSTEIQKQIKEADEINKNLSNKSLQLNFSQLNINTSESLQINISQLNINENESCQINISHLNINENESSQISTISQLNVNEDSQNSESGSKRKNHSLSQNNESESERKKIRIE